MKQPTLPTRAYCIACALLSLLLAARFWPQAALAQPPASRPATAVASLAPPDAAQLRALIEAIALGRDPSAADRLLDTWVTPLAAALGNSEQRPREEQKRLIAALQRVNANLQLQVWRASLDAPDQARIDRVLASERSLLESLFDIDERVRLAALERIPLQKDTAAGLLIAAKFFDPNAEVVDAAVEKARQLRDETVVRGLRKFSRDALDLLAAEGSNAEPAAVIVYASYLERAAVVIAEHGSPADVPLVSEVLLKLATPALEPFAALSHEALDAIGRIGEESAAPALRAYLDRGVLQPLQGDGETRVTRSVGDAALLALCRVYKLDPARLGFVQPAKERPQMGFADPETRVRARLHFEDWYRRNADKNAAQRESLSELPPVAQEQPR